MKNRVGKCKLVGPALDFSCEKNGWEIWNDKGYLVAQKKRVFFNQPLACSNNSTFVNLKAAFLKKVAAFFCRHVGIISNKKEAGVFLSSPAWRSTRKSRFKNNWNFSDFQIDPNWLFFWCKNSQIHLLFWSTLLGTITYPRSQPACLSRWVPELPLLMGYVT